MTKDQTPSREEVIAWARESNREWDCDRDMIEWLEWFAALAYAAGAEAEREMCALVCDAMWTGRGDLGAICSSAIRARKDNT